MVQTFICTRHSGTSTLDSTSHSHIHPPHNTHSPAHSFKHTMCRICTDPLESLVNLTYLDCSYCPLLTSIPPELVNLTQLYCSHCPLLTSIPPTLVKLTYLNCSNCPLLTSIPPTLVNLTDLYCFHCPLLTAIPHELVHLIALSCYGCPWLVRNAAAYPLHLPAVSRIQTWFKRGTKQAFKRYIRTRAFNEWFWAGDAAGGRVHKRHMEWTMKRKTEK